MIYSQDGGHLQKSSFLQFEQLRRALLELSHSSHVRVCFIGIDMIHAVDTFAGAEGNFPDFSHFQGTFESHARSKFYSKKKVIHFLKAHAWILREHYAELRTW